MIRLAIPLLLLVFSGPAEALSCLRPDAVRLYEAARDSADPYWIVKGRVDFREPPAAPDPDLGEPAATRARLSGMALTTHAFGAPFDRDIVVELTCAGPWCADTENLGRELVVALKVTDAGPVLEIGPCRENVVEWSRDAERRLLACHRGGPCALPQ